MVMQRSENMMMAMNMGMMYMRMCRFAAAEKFSEAC